jgi:hypothetical protein
LLRDVVDDDDGVGDIVVPAAPREEVKVVVLALREEEEEDGLEFSIVFTRHARGPRLTKRERKKYLVFRTNSLLLFPRSLCRQR